MQWGADLRSDRRVLKRVDFVGDRFMSDIALWLLDVHFDFDVGSSQIIGDGSCRRVDLNAIRIKCAVGEDGGER